MGLGPRGLILLERLCAGAAADPGRGPVTVHAVDPAPPGAGRVWRTDQSPHLLMNTVAEQITVFTDASVVCEGPVVPGPNVYEWAGLLTAASRDAPGPDIGPGSEHPDAGSPGSEHPGSEHPGSEYPGSEYPREVLREARELGPNSYPTRAFYGHYLRWAYRRTVRTAPPHVTVHLHQDTAVALEELDGRQLLRLARCPPARAGSSSTTRRRRPPRPRRPGAVAAR
ncbi:FAD/NAD(P)-binding protein, partial [Kitasatospora sp. NPDC036755]|uniref:FAD/NAD(P)-binding protein n=1 Tax=Kitasatospora sp. NPDC036755 TaxID=3154600 RepID=UPI0033F404D3